MYLKIMNIKSYKKIFIVSLLLNLFLLCTLSIVGMRSGYFQRQLIRLGIMEASREDLEDNWQAYHAIVGWNKTLTTLKPDCDICFFGNSITNQIPFADSIKGKTVAVIGYPGAGFEMLHYTAPLVQAVHPRKLFVMAGINSLGNLDDMQFRKEYNALIDRLLPPPPPIACEVYLESLLPLNHTKGNDKLTNQRIQEANIIIRRIAMERGFTYIDLYNEYVDSEGEMPSEYSRDGIHLYPEAYNIWLKKIEKYIQ